MEGAEAKGAEEKDGSLGKGRRRGKGREEGGSEEEEEEEGGGQVRGHVCERDKTSSFLF